MFAHHGCSCRMPQPCGGTSCLRTLFIRGRIPVHRLRSASLLEMILWSTHWSLHYCTIVHLCDLGAFRVAYGSTGLWLLGEPKRDPWRAREMESEKVARKMDPSAAKVIGCIVVSWWVDTSPLQSNCTALVRPPKITPARTHVSKC